MNMAITGATGQLGAALVRRLLEEGHQVRVLIRKDDRAVAGLPVSKIYGSLENDEALRQLVSGAEVVYHLAGRISIGHVPELALQETNVDGTRRVINVCRQEGVRRMVHFSSVHAYAAVPADKPFDETAPPATAFPYERTKAAAQALVVAANGSDGLETICLNPTAVLGPLDYKPSLQGQMILDLINRRLPLLTPGGFDWVDSRDVAQAAAAAASRGKPGSCYLLSGKYAGMLDLAAMVGWITGQKPPERAAPFWLLKSIAPILETWSRLRNQPALFTRESLSHVEKGHPNVSNARAVADLGFAPRPLEDTLRDTCMWFTTQFKHEHP